jgi:CRISPR/Cas system-associated exonuclease Cas4 (RecB family)
MNKIDISMIEDYAICPARAYMNTDLKEKPVKQQILSRMRRGLNDVLLASMGKPDFDPSAIDRVCNLIAGEGDVEDTAPFFRDLFVNFNYLLKEYEYTITGAVMPFELAYNGIIVTSAIDFTVKDEKRGYILPCIFDFSKTKYEPHYNPIVYRTQTLVDHMDILKKNTEVVVFTPASGKRWVYDKARFSKSINISINEMVQAIKDELYYHRVGWWCAGCPYRGICFKIMSGIK